MNRCQKCLSRADIDLRYSGAHVAPLCLSCADRVMFRLAEETGEWDGYEKWKRHVEEAFT